VTLTGEGIVGLFLLIVLGVAVGNLLGDFFFCFLNPDMDDDE
jgi:ABC-type dipeptide/oligopeptide/nickel transport system permease component